MVGVSNFETNLEGGALGLNSAETDERKANSRLPDIQDKYKKTA